MRALKIAVVARIQFITALASCIRDRDAIYGAIYGMNFSRQANDLYICEVVTSPQSPWHNPYIERITGSIRRVCVDQVIVPGERHLKRVLGEYVDCYNQTRTHLSLDKDAPGIRENQKVEDDNVVSVRRVGGLHHQNRPMAA